MGCVLLQVLPVQIVNGTLFVAGEMTGFLEFNRITKARQAAPFSLHSLPVEQQSGSQLLLPLQLFFLDVARHHKLPDVDIVFSTAGVCSSQASFGVSACQPGKWRERHKNTSLWRSAQVCRKLKQKTTALQMAALISGKNLPGMQHAAR